MEIRLVQSVFPFDLEHTLGCGQAFRWEKFNGWWYGVVKKRVIQIKQMGNKLEFHVFPSRMDEELIRSYFRLDDDLPRILSRINRDKHIQKAIQRFYGLRITRQEPWECLISYICATYKNIPAIRSIIHNLAKKFGQKIRVKDRLFYTFPEPHNMAEATLEELRKCKLGYRAKHILETSRTIHRGELDLEALRTMRYEKAKEELTRLPGVGQKVADCVLLFSMDKLEAFPVDRWIKRVILESYSDHFEEFFLKRISRRSSLTPHEYEEISLFGREYFGEYAGYAQEYNKRFTVSSNRT